MKTYTLWIAKYQYADKVESDTKQHAIAYIKRKLGLTWLDNVICLGINL